MTLGWGEMTGSLVFASGNSQGASTSRGRAVSVQVLNKRNQEAVMTITSDLHSGEDRPLLKGSVQRKLRWVENGVNRCVDCGLWTVDWDCGAGHFYVVLLRLHLVFTIFLFPVSIAEFIGEFWKNKRSAKSDVAPIVLALYRIRYWRYVDSCA